MRISDWSSDVCSSDLPGERFAGDTLIPHAQRAGAARKADVIGRPVVADERRDQPAVAPRNVAVEEGPDVIAPDVAGFDRSEERRVGKECVRKGRSGWWTYHLKKKKTTKKIKNK